MKIKLSKKNWEEMGRKAGWMKVSKVDEREIQLIKNETDRPKKIKDLMDLYVRIHPNASGYELNTLWNDLGQISIEDINAYIDKYASKWGEVWMEEDIDETPYRQEAPSNFPEILDNKGVK